MEESPRERAISSEPCSGRPNPFDDVAEQTSRKRQRVSRGGSRSRSVDTARDSSIVPSSPLRRTTTEPDPTPSTPTRIPSERPLAEPTSSRVTINLRAARNLESIPSSPPSPSPATPSKMERRSEEAGTRISVESESDALSTVQAMGTPSSSPSDLGSPQVELVLDDEDPDFIDTDPPVAIISPDDEETLYDDPMSNFPYYSKGEPLVETLSRVTRFLQFDDISNDEAFCKLRDWIDSYLVSNTQMDLFYDSYVKNRKFWNKLPDIIWSLSYRSRFFGDFLRRNREGRQALTEMLCQFARLAGRFVAMDVRTLACYEQENASDQGPDLGSRTYLAAFSHLIRKEDGSPHIGKNLETHYNWNYDDDVLILSDSFQTEGGTISALTKLTQGQLHTLSQNPKLVEHLTDPCRIVHHFSNDTSTSLEHNEIQHQQLLDAAMEKILQGYEFFKIMSDGLNLIIEKHITFLSPDAATCHLTCLPTIFRNSLVHDNTISQEFLENLKPELSVIPRKHLAKVVALEWKFGILKKLITSAQMQLRVVGVTTMCSDLLSLHGSHKGSDVTASPVLLYFATLILDNKLVDYLVGIGSHPEIINESSNILGFLVVTRTYKPQLTDTIWQTVMTSQDPRVVDSIVKMVQRCMNLCDYPSLIYLCKKVSNVPIEAFTPVMREFCSQLFQDLPRKAYVDNPTLLPPPYELCVRLIRESSIVTPDAPSGNHEIQTFAASKLRELLQNGPGPDTRNTIYLSCIKDISDRTPTAAGSICVINALLKQNMATDLRVLTTTHGLTKLLVEELEAVIRSDRMVSIQPVRNTPASIARRELLLSIISYEPSTITSDLGKRLWDILVGSESRTTAERSMWWTVLNNAIKKPSSSKNVFLTACINEHLPRLPPRCFMPGALDFAREAVLLWLEESRHSFIEEDRKFESHALEQIWHMILTAPPNTIDASAITILVEVYVESALIQSLPRTKARSIHLGLVDRCLEQLRDAASKMKKYGDGASSGSEESMVIVASEDQFLEQEKIFTRSLAVLRNFLIAYQQKPQFAIPKPRPSIAAVSSTVEGEPLTVKYQSFDGDKHTEVKSLTLGKQNTAASLIASLQKATGFKNYKVYCGGKVFEPDEIEVCKSLDDLNLNGLFLVQRREDVDGVPGQHSSIKMTLELEIMKHFDDLWNYLSMHEKVANEIYNFLITFPVYDQLLQNFDAQTSYSVIFPQGQPFKSLYGIHAIREYIKSRQQKGTHDELALTRAISLIVAAISDPDVLDHCASDDAKNYLALNLIDCLVWLLKEPVLPSAVAEILDEALMKRLLQLLLGAKTTVTSQNSVHLTGRSFEALLETSIHNIELWKKLILHFRSNPILLELVLEDPRPLIRKSIVKQIANKCNSFTPSLAPVSSTNFAVEFWPMIASLIPQALHQPHQCEELLSIALTIFKRLAETSLDFLRLGDLVKQWGGLLMLHSAKESVGHPDSVDAVAQGLSSLLFYAASFAKAAQQTLACSDIGTELFRKHLFPDLSVDDDEDDAIEAKLPLLNPLTRRTLAETVFLLVKDDEAQYNTLLSSLAALVPYDTDPHDGTPYSYELSYQFERTKSIRSLTGYVGLKNLSNTCYLNSLFTQLFMNIPFRQFMLEAHVADGGASQKLLSETQNLFSYMQNSLRRYVDPTNLASSIRTWEETQIDVTIQMDVDEFYNLLFDRWEGQILAPDAKRKLRAFYGGQLVQQVKSKECSHISERLEPFSAIQCDIKGKSSLQESLQAYVDGEIMEGDNKYKCSTCDRHVDAVKRACLKDVPDNLIFHLKRFDFNLRTLQRSKINDHFSFPNKIDMKPYKVEHLMDGPEETPEDIFELVGVLVHSGTAESGHYYSFIRERPSNEDKENWVEFNDDSVTPWDPSCMEGSCFGGVDYRGPVDNGNLHYDKTWSAYMLFYQRSSVVSAQKQMLDLSGQLSPVHLPVPQRLANHIAMENELLMRKYCLYDPSHVAFVEAMLMNIKNINGGHCSSTHVLEKLALTAALQHLDQVIARTKEVPNFSKFMIGLGQICRACAECSRDYLEWFCDYPETLRQLLLRNPDAQVRNDIANSIINALNKVKSDAPYAYGIGYNDESDDEVEGGPPDLFLRILKALEGLWEIFHTSTRAWPEYFGLLSSISKMGKRESVSLLNAGFLLKTLEVISADAMLQITPQYTRMLNIISKRIATRPVSYDGVIDLACRLIQTCDSSQRSVNDMDDRMEFLDNEEPIPFSSSERNLLMQHWVRNNVHILTEKLYMIHQNYDATDTILIDLLQWTDSLDQIIFQAIVHGIRRGLPSVSCAPFLHAAAIYCEHSMNPRAIIEIMSQVSKIAQHLDNTEGRSFIDFFNHIYSLPEAVQYGSIDEIQVSLLKQISVWAPALLTYYEAGVRQDTERFIDHNIMRPFGLEIDDDPDSEKAKILRESIQRLAFACLEFLQETYIRNRQTAVRATLHNIQRIIEACGCAFSGLDFDPDDVDALPQRYEDLKHTVLASLKKYIVEEADEEVSDWDGSEEYDGSSEPMDGLGTVDNDDIQL